MFVLAGKALAPVRILENFLGRPIEEASFSSPVRITGFSELPAVGDEFRTYADKNEAEETLAKTKEKIQTQIKDSKQNIGQGNKVAIKMIIKTDTAGSLEALEKELMKTKDEEVAIELLKGGVGNINEDDARFSSVSKNSVILGFNVATDPSAKEIIDRNSVPFFISDIIYKISDWLKEEITKKKSGNPERGNNRLGQNFKNIQSAKKQASHRRKSFFRKNS